MFLIKYQATDFPILILHHFFISSALNALCHARISDSKWVSIIYVDIPAPTYYLILYPHVLILNMLGKPIYYLWWLKPHYNLNFFYRMD